MAIEQVQLVVNFYQTYGHTAVEEVNHTLVYESKEAFLADLEVAVEAALFAKARNFKFLDFVFETMDFTKLVDGQTRRIFDAPDVFTLAEWFDARRIDQPPKTAKSCLKS